MGTADYISAALLLIFVLVVVVTFFRVKKQRVEKAVVDEDTYHRIEIAGGFIMLRGNEVEKFKKESKAIQLKMVHAQQKLIKAGHVKIAKYKGKQWLVGPLEFDRMKKDGVLENE